MHMHAPQTPDDLRMSKGLENDEQRQFARDVFKRLIEIYKTQDALEPLLGANQGTISRAARGQVSPALLLQAAQLAEWDPIATARILRLERVPRPNDALPKTAPSAKKAGLVHFLNQAKWEGNEKRARRFLASYTGPNVPGTSSPEAYAIAYRDAFRLWTREKPKRSV